MCEDCPGRDCSYYKLCKLYGIIEGEIVKCECCCNEFLRRQVKEIKGQFFCKPCLDLLQLLAGELRPRVVVVRKEGK